MDLRVLDDPATATAAWIGRRLRDAVRRRGEAHLAVSGGSTAPPMLAALAAADVDWRRVTVWQVDERVVPDGHPDRNATQLDGFPARVRPMPVTSKDLAAAARRYGAALPARLDVVHLGVGDDGHTASWPPGDPVVDSTRPCEVIGEFNGHRRMTLTPPVVNGARSRIVLIAGAGKAPIVARWLLRDATLPIDRVHRSHTWVFLDRAAAADLPEPSQ
jgi:6-phosphogluconolactonase